MAAKVRGPAPTDSVKGPGTGSRGIIVVVEDDADTRAGLQYALEEEAYEVFSTGNGNEALERLHSTPNAAVVLLDLYMPGLSGFEFYQRLRASPQLRSIPVIVVTAAPPRARIGLDVSAIVRKPIDVKELLMAIRSAVPRA
ncbi:MAG: response regulator [Gemmatimonadales bacterium]